MDESRREFRLRILRQVFWNLGLISVGSVLCAVAINGILIPHEFVSGGFTGLALVIFNQCLEVLS